MTSVPLSDAMQHRTRRAFLLLFTVGAVIAACAQPAPPEGPQPARVVRIGIMAAGNDSPYFHGLLQGLRELGYVGGQNLSIERRFTDARTALPAAAAAELVHL